MAESVKWHLSNEPLPVRLLYGSDQGVYLPVDGDSEVHDENLRAPLDRIDLHIEVPAVRYRKLSSSDSGEKSEIIRERVAIAREHQAARFRGLKGMYANADMQTREIRQFCRLDGAGEELLKTAITKIGLSARAYDRILKVGRTIADLAAAPEILPDHIGEAIQYRSLDRNMI